MSDENTNGGRRQVRGRVISNKMEKTVVVQVERTVKHARYHKYIKQVRSFKAHDEDTSCKVNDLVVIEESRPLSRTKRWRVIERVVTSTVEA
jgi:small subunit ribosomal protein S17